jgi:hypothetical protein
VDCIAQLADVHYPVLVMPPGIAVVGRVREALGVPGPMSVEGYELMGKNWRFTSEKAKRELGYAARPIAETLEATVDWYLELMEAGAFEDVSASALSTMAKGMRGAASLGLFRPVRIGQSLLGRRVVTGV